MKKLLCLFLAVLLTFGCVSVSAEMMIMSSSYFDTYYISVSSQGGGSIGISFYVRGMEVSDVLGYSSYVVQRYVNGSWTTVSTGSGSLGYNVLYHSFTRTYSGTSGETYRVRGTATCTNSNGTATQTVYSSSVVAN